jgi:hypothetical protein
MDRPSPHCAVYQPHTIRFLIDQADGGSLGEAYENNGQSDYIQSLPFPMPDVLYAAGTQRSVGKVYPWVFSYASPSEPPSA